MSHGKAFLNSADRISAMGERTVGEFWQFALVDPNEPLRRQVRITLKTIGY